MHEVKLNAKGSKGSKGAPIGRKVLKIDRPKGRRVLKFDGPTARGLWYRPAGNDYKVSVTGLAFVSSAVHGEVPEPPSLGRGAPQATEYSGFPTEKPGGCEKMQK